MRARSLVRQEEAICPTCRQAAHPEAVSLVEEGSELANRPLAELGIPPYDIVRIDGARETRLLLAELGRQYVDEVADEWQLSR